MTVTEWRNSHYDRGRDRNSLIRILVRKVYKNTVLISDFRSAGKKNPKTYFHLMDGRTVVRTDGWMSHGRTLLMNSTIPSVTSGTLFVKAKRFPWNLVVSDKPQSAKCEKLHFPFRIPICHYASSFSWWQLKQLQEISLILLRIPWKDFPITALGFPDLQIRCADARMISEKYIVVVVTTKNHSTLPVHKSRSTVASWIKIVGLLECTRRET